MKSKKDKAMAILLRLAKRVRAARRHIRDLQKESQTPTRDRLLAWARDRENERHNALQVAKEIYYRKDESNAG
jgi:hypothetical protein